MPQCYLNEQCEDLENHGGWPSRGPDVRFGLQSVSSVRIRHADAQPVHPYAASRHRAQQPQPGSRQAGVGDCRLFRLAPFAAGNLILMCLMWT